MRSNIYDASNTHCHLDEVRVRTCTCGPLAAAMAESVVSSSAKRVCLPLKKKIEVLQEVKRRPKETVRELAQQFQCGKTQIASILEKLWSEFESNSSPNTSKGSHSAKFANVNSALYAWYTLVCSKNNTPWRGSNDGVNKTNCPAAWCNKLQGHKRLAIKMEKAIQC